MKKTFRKIVDAKKFSEKRCEKTFERKQSRGMLSQKASKKGNSGNVEA